MRNLNNMSVIVLASNNKHKIEEFKQMLKYSEILSLEDIGFNGEIDEDGGSFLDNAIIKAKTIHKYLKEKNIEASVIADDSGLCVDALHGDPGIYSARYAGEHGNSAKNREKLLSNLKGKDDRGAYFICVVAKCYPNGKCIWAEGRTYGEILTEECGDKSFGYDCLFYSKEINKSFGEATKEEKNKISHRGRAINALIDKEKDLI